MSIKENNANVVSMCTQRVAGLSKFVKTKTPMRIHRQLMKLSDVVGVYQACLDTRAEVVSQRAAYEKALEARDSAEVARQAIDPGVKAWAENEFGPGSPEAKELGFLPRKAAEKDVATKATAIERNLATRKARQTMGKRQKEKVKGTIQVLTVPAVPAVTTPAVTPTASVTAATTTTDASSAPVSPSNGVAASH